MGYITKSKSYLSLSHNNDLLIECGYLFFSSFHIKVKRPWVGVREKPSEMLWKRGCGVSCFLKVKQTFFKSLKG
jgi:hypothetical protein